MRVRAATASGSRRSVQRAGHPRRRDPTRAPRPRPRPPGSVPARGHERDQEPLLNRGPPRPGAHHGGTPTDPRRSAHNPRHATAACRRPGAGGASGTCHHALLTRPVTPGERENNANQSNGHCRFNRRPADPRLLHARCRIGIRAHSSRPRVHLSALIGCSTAGLEMLVVQSAGVRLPRDLQLGGALLTSHHFSAIPLAYVGVFVSLSGWVSWSRISSARDRMPSLR
jgi:hypothetical protein